MDVVCLNNNLFWLKIKFSIIRCFIIHLYNTVFLTAWQKKIWWQINFFYYEMKSLKFSVNFAYWFNHIYFRLYSTTVVKDDLRNNICSNKYSLSVLSHIFRKQKNKGGKKVIYILLRYPRLKPKTKKVFFTNTDNGQMREFHLNDSWKKPKNAPFNLIICPDWSSSQIKSLISILTAFHE